jgi:endo-1,4-beta-xylanase
MMKDYKNCLTIIMMLFFTIVFSYKPYAQMANGQSKFVGNIMRSEVPDNYDSYWNQVTPENSGKWGVVEGTRDVMNWTDLDLAYNYAQQNNMPFKQHTLVWGAQAPSWIDALSPAEQAAELEQWIRLYSERYPNTQMIDVVNEPLHVIPSFKNAIGGDGVTGWDWVIWSFQKARQYNPNAKLILNDYSILANKRNTTKYIEIINLLKTRGLIDGIGVQAHGLEYARLNSVTSTLNDLAATGLPIYISELDLEFASDTDQLNRYKQLWPILYEHPGVLGVTLWGYEKGKHWKPNAYLIGQGGTVGSWTVGTAYQDFVASGSGNLQVAFTNDTANNVNDLEVDYVIIDGVTYQAEDMAVNTGVYQNNSCGGSFSQIMNCDGYIQFPSVNQSMTIRARGITGNETMQANVVNPNAERPALTWLREVYFGGTSGSNPPSVVITSPSSGAIYSENTTFTITATASDSDGTIASVKFYANGNLIATDTTAPYQANYTIVSGNVSLTAVATDNNALSTTSSAINVSTQGGSGSSMHVQSLTTSVVGAGQGNKKGQVVVAIVDNNGTPVANATVVGNFSGTFVETVSGITQSNGQVILQTSGSKKGSVIVNFCVNNVSHPTLVYNPSQNVITCTNGGTSNKSASGSNKNSGSNIILVPSDDKLSISSSEEMVQSIRVYNILGKLLFTQKNVSKKSTQIYDYDFTFNKNQLYILHIKTDSNVEIKKIIIK